MSYENAIKAGMWIYDTFSWPVSVTRYGGFEVEFAEDEILVLSSQEELIEYAKSKGWRE
jgi:hypothetical protein